ATSSSSSDLRSADLQSAHDPSLYWATEMKHGGHVGFVLSEQQEGIPLEKIRLDFGPYVFGKTIHVLGK
ncbi:unnamed protein product, partial [Amoebophrya sp. A25]